MLVQCGNLLRINIVITSIGPTTWLTKSGASSRIVSNRWRLQLISFSYSERIARGLRCHFGLLAGQRYEAQVKLPNGTSALLAGTDMALETSNCRFDNR
ncbi:unnamed protein product [Sphagnum jensenii]|uniref:Uncharacterized protein n=1 Tax=Sphagnum jensenii TaxID=128206 RepID=A0ABP1BF40_9BRYO